MPEQWNFCPWCGHRTYQHGAISCEHKDQKRVYCPDPQCGDSTWDHDCEDAIVDVPCECKAQFVGEVLR
jgi:hypothetical protein